jgi:hypothetical protein
MVPNAGVGIYPVHTTQQYTRCDSGGKAMGGSDETLGSISRSKRPSPTSGNG